MSSKRSRSIRVFHTGAPVAASNATATSSLPLPKRVKTFPPATAIPEYPVPSLARHSTRGPDSGKVFSRPVSPVMPSPLGPR